jgi:hypothetical protein
VSNVTDYDWRTGKSKSWQHRYPGWIQGVSAWEKASLGAIPQRVEPGQRPPLPQTPCVFISHKQADEELALDVWKIAKTEGFDVWLDVLDPDLRNFAGQPATLTADQRAIVLASIIEIALLNSTHVLAVITRESHASRWIPYEYGRIKDPRVLSTTVAAYVVPGRGGNVAEDMHLGSISQDETGLREWLKQEALGWPILRAVRQGIAQGVAQALQGFVK